MTPRSDLAPIQYTELIIFILTRTIQPPNNSVVVGPVSENELRGKFNQKGVFYVNAVISLTTGSKKGGFS